ncbi:hypothetical protein [Kiloniella laminariae]|uniref:hypothetical protein n=1 Tax=Kiloniella laminariae TaxID=454162 RepID=UPI00037CE990|nr:hypothetical protein [Kiloniella laminariae]
MTAKEVAKPTAAKAAAVKTARVPLATAEAPEKSGATAPVKVRAIKLGYYGVQLRQVGDAFDLRDPAHFSTSWMEKL